jgi:hypothetical protein
MLTVEPFVPKPSTSEFQVAVGKLRSYKAPDTDQTSAELIEGGGGILCSEVHKLLS